MESRIDNRLNFFRILVKPKFHYTDFPVTSGEVSGKSG